MSQIKMYKVKNQEIKHIDRYETSHMKTILITLIELHRIFAMISLSISNDYLD